MNENINKINDQELENVAGGAITPDEALQRALERVGLRRDQVDFIKKVEPDFERGRMIFEVEFYKDGFEYEFNIDGENGNVLKCSRDRD